MLLLDLDGTLADTRALILRTFHDVWQHHFSYRPDDAVFATTVGLPLKSSLQTLVESEKAAARLVNHEPLDTLVERLLQHYTERNFELHDSMIRPFPGVREALDDLHAAGHRLGVVTSKRRRGALRNLEWLGLERYFEVVVGFEDTARHKPYADPVAHALGLVGIAAERAAYAGDAPCDMQCGRAAGVRTVAATWGANDVAALLAEKPDAVADCPADLYRLLSEASATM